MSGYPDNNFSAFDDAKAACIAMGHEVVSPADLSRAHGWDPKRVPTPEEYADFMREDVRAILDCDAVMMLEGWQESKGATFERLVAQMTGRKVLTLESCSP